MRGICDKGEGRLVREGGLTRVRHICVTCQMQMEGEGRTFQGEGLALAGLGLRLKGGSRDRCAD